jgi:RecA-family ATPase
VSEREFTLYNPVPFPTMLDGPREIEWLIDGIMPRTTAGIMAGEPGIGKTWILMDLVLAIASGVSWLGKYKTKECKVLVVDEENAEVLIRQRYHSMKWQYEPKNKLDNIDFLVGKNVDITPLEHMKKGLQPSSDFTLLYNTIAEHEYDLVVFDSLTRIHHADENDSARMSAVFGYVKRLMNDLGVSVLFTHHFNKSRGHNNNRLRGSSDILAFPDYVLRVESDRGHTGLSETGVLIEHSKSRWGVNTGKVYVRLDEKRERPEDEPKKIISFISNEDLEDGMLLYLTVARTKEDVVGEMEGKGLGTPAQIDRMLGKLIKQRKIYRPTKGIYQVTGGSGFDDLEDLI